MTRKVLATLFMASAFITADAVVTVTGTTGGSVTIAVTGDAGQIGTETDNYGNKSYAYTSNVTADAQDLIKNATSLTITGNINAADIKTLVDKNAVSGAWTIGTLDMGGATIPSITVEATGPWSISSHDFMPNGWTKITATNVVLPKTDNGILPNYFGVCFKNAPTMVTLPEGYTSLGDYAFSNTTNLISVNLPEGLISIGANAFEYSGINYITFPNTLESIGNLAFRQCPNLKVVVFPASLKTLGDEVFSLTFLEDIYFLGLEAPTVGPNAFDKNTYTGNNGFTPTSATFQVGNTDNGFAERANYYGSGSQNNKFGLLHVRADLTNEQRAKYVDITRQYVVEKGDDNKYKAYYDLYNGAMKIWPGQYSWNHTYNDAVRGTLWDEVTPYSAEKYMGLHKFTLTVSDIYYTDTKIWTFDKLQPDQWWTICVPFSMTKAQVREVFGDYTEVCKFSGVVRDLPQKLITLKFQDDRYKAADADGDVVIEKNISYMIFPTKTLAAGEKYKLDGYQLGTGSPEPTTVKAVDENEQPTDYTYRFIGTYLNTWDANAGSSAGQGTPITMPKYSYFLGARGTDHVFFYQTGTTGKWNPFTATVQVFKGQVYEGIDDSFIFSSGSNAKLTSLFGSMTGETTGLERVVIEAGQSGRQGVYNLNGQLVSPNTDSLSSLPAGLYIVNGKKHVVK